MELLAASLSTASLEDFPLTPASTVLLEVTNESKDPADMWVRLKINDKDGNLKGTFWACGDTALLWAGINVAVRACIRRP